MLIQNQTLEILLQPLPLALDQHYSPSLFSVHGGTFCEMQVQTFIDCWLWKQDMACTTEQATADRAYMAIAHEG